MTFSKLEWSVFRACQQEGKNRRQAADELGITYDRVCETLSYMKIQEPLLFFVDSERRSLSRHVGRKHQEQYNMDVVSYDARKSETDDIDSEIREKF